MHGGRKRERKDKGGTSFLSNIHVVTFIGRNRLSDKMIAFLS